MGKIILLGYMGSGKSTIAKALHLKTGIPAYDLDLAIEKKHDLSIKEIFERKGELYFRKAEHQTLKELLQEPAHFILSLGGGTPCYFNNMDLLLETGADTFYLKTSINTLYQRLVEDTFSRPLLTGKDAEEAKEFIAKHLFERLNYYSRAKYTVSTDDKQPEEIADEIIALLA